MNIKELSFTVGKPPQFAENPYQENLIRGLEGKGIHCLRENLNYLLLAQLRNNNKIDIIHLDWLHPYYKSRNRFTSTIRCLSFINKISLLKLQGSKLVWTAHNLTSHSGSNPVLDRLVSSFVVKTADAIIAHCEAAKEQIILDFKLKNPEKVYVIPHGNYIDCYPNTTSAQAARSQLGIAPDAVTLLFMGIIRPNKGIYDLINAVEALGDSRLHLLVVGKPYPGEAEHIRQRLSQLPSTTFIPEYVPNDKIQLYMNAADVVAFPYKNILTSGAVILAMSYGRACIAPRLGCMAETLENSRGAFLYDSKNPEGLKEAIQKALDASASLAAMGAYNRKQADRWNWNAIAQMTLEVYQHTFNHPCD